MRSQVAYTRLTKTGRRPAVDGDQIRPIDAVLLSHGQHFDNLDRAQGFLQNAARVLTTVTGTARVQHRRSGVVGNHQAERSRDAICCISPRHLLATDLQASNRRLERSRFLDCRGQLESSTAIHYQRYRLVRWDCGGRRPLGSKPGDALPAPPARAVPSISPRIQTMSSRSRTRFPTQ
jgi:hypothetical protein